MESTRIPHIERIAYNALVDGLHTASDGKAIRRVCGRFSQALDLPWFSHVTLGSAQPQILSSLPKKWVQQYLKCRFYEIDNALVPLRQSGNPFRWRVPAPPASRPGRDRDAAEHLLTLPVRSGFTIPIPAGFDRVAACMFMSDTDSFAPVPADLIPLLQQAAYLIHAHIDAKQSNRDDEGVRPAVTQRSQECLAWIASGKTMDEIATILQLSPRSVRFHLDNARVALGANTLPEAIGSAFRWGLLR